MNSVNIYLLSLVLCFCKSLSRTLFLSSSSILRRSQAPKFRRLRASNISPSLISLSRRESVVKLGEWLTCQSNECKYCINRVVKISRQPAHFAVYSDKCAGFSNITKTKIRKSPLLLFPPLLLLNPFDKPGIYRTCIRLPLTRPRFCNTGHPPISQEFYDLDL